MSYREAVIREGLWSESTLVRGASPDDTIATLVLTDKFDPTAPQVVGARSDPVVPEARANGDPSCYVPEQHPPFSCADDWNRLVPEFCADVDAVLNCRNIGILFVAGGVSYAFHQSIDDDVAEGFERHPNRWGSIQDFFAGLGNPAHHFAAIGGLYLYSLHTQDSEMHELSKSLFNAVAITGLSTIALKETIGRNTTAPNREPDPFCGAWPSGHTSSAFAFAAVLDEYYGPCVGIPAYVLAGLVGWERIDDGEHDLSDVVFGAVLGFVIGKTVAAEHQMRFCGMELQPLVDPASGATGICLERRF
jgi:membrane-associated phospholipid phosphatase